MGEGFWWPGHMEPLSEALWLVQVPSGDNRVSSTLSLRTESLGSKVQTEGEVCSLKIKEMKIRAE